MYLIRCLITTGSVVDTIKPLRFRRAPDTR